MADDKDNKLLNEIKNYLEITWDDSLGDEKIRGMVKRGMAAISRTFSGTYSDDTSTLTINASETIWGGIKMLMLK